MWSVETDVTLVPSGLHHDPQWVQRSRTSGGHRYVLMVCMWLPW